MYRAYGCVAIEKYEVALQDIKRATKISKLDAASVYNRLLGKGILRLDHEDYSMATKKPLNCGERWCGSQSK